MTNEEQIEFNKSLVVSCRGPRRIEGDRLRAINSRRINLDEAENNAELRTLVDGLNALLGVNVLVENESTSELNMAILKLIDIRTPCGQDLNAMIGAPPFDGLQNQAPCPKCGILIRWTPALSDEEATAGNQEFLAAASSLGEPTDPASE